MKRSMPTLKRLWSGSQRPWLNRERTHGMEGVSKCSIRQREKKCRSMASIGRTNTISRCFPDEMLEMRLFVHLLWTQQSLRRKHGRTHVREAVSNYLSGYRLRTDVVFRCKQSGSFKTSESGSAWTSASFNCSSPSLMPRICGIIL